MQKSDRRNGLSISYDTVLEVSAQLGDVHVAVGRYQEERVVCPPVLFTKAAKDNIDHYPTATTATTSFHGKAICFSNIRDLSVKKVPELPDSYTNIRPAALSSKNTSPQSPTQKQTFTYQNLAYKRV